MSDAILFADGYREWVANPDRRWWQFWKPKDVLGPMRSYVPRIPDGWELWDDEEGRVVASRLDVIHPLIINRSDPTAPIGMYIQWAPRT